ncbi:hypothetical protein Rhopal_004271-T1 [Rhodotorula paludigena]|uniref:F-box domain-containing protein n=1 Tax=Rhodotorula paludigena TaxID=86838 RepID=A0AAV5GRE4_9BASI|nr:hypothetical protein Rhopal_004271-T1 [Rhodotorula paludigena]
MSSAAPDSALGPRAGLESLPDELLSHVVSRVRRQDELARLNSPIRVSSKLAGRENSGGVLDDNGKLSWWYAHGVHALSLVSRKFRRLALPSLCTILTSKQCGHAFLEFGGLPQAILDGVKILDLRTVSLSTFLASARSLANLPKIRFIHIALERLTKVLGSPNGTRVLTNENKTRLDFAQSAFRRKAPAVSQLAVELEGDPDGDAVEYFELFADPTALRELGVDSPTRSCCPDSTFLPRVLKKFDCLTMLVVRDAAPCSFQALAATIPWRHIQLPSLRYLELHASSSAVLEFAAQLAPALKTLHIKMTANLLQFADVPSLSTVRLEIVHNRLHGGTDVALGPVLTAIASLPRSTTFNLVLPRCIAFLDLAELKQACSARDIRLGVTDKDVLAPFSPPASRDSPGCFDPQRQADAVTSALEWAMERVNRAKEVGDTAGVQEMAELARRIEERRYLETL